MVEKISRCRSCGAPILWIETSRGKKHPVDAEQICEFVVPGSWYRETYHHVFLVVAGRWGMRIKSETPFKAHTSHFDTCPNASEHRKTKPSGDTGPESD